MSWRGRRALAVVAGLSVGLVAGGAAGFLAQGRGQTFPPKPSSHSSAPPPQVVPVRATTLLAWTPGGLPGGFAGRAGRLRPVGRSVAVVDGTAWMTRSVSAGGAIVDRPPRGMAIPLEVAAAPLASYAPFLSPADRAFVPALARGEALLGASSARFRRLGPGGVLWFGSRHVRVAGVVPDTEIGAAELFVSGATARTLGVTRTRYLLIDPARGTSREHLTARLRVLLPAGLPLQVRGPGETPYFRQGDAVLPPILMKELLGEFAAHPHAAPGGWLTIDPAWARRYLVTTSVPILGRITCNRGIMQQLRGALDEVVRDGLAHLIDPKQYAGCYAPRLLRPDDPTAGISHHAWGAAIDINAGSNPFGGTPHLDLRIVRIFERWGFTWGGHWLIPDGMHFEFTRFAASV